MASAWLYQAPSFVQDLHFQRYCRSIRPVLNPVLMALEILSRSPAKPPQIRKAGAISITRNNLVFENFVMAVKFGQYFNFAKTIPKIEKKFRTTGSLKIERWWRGSNGFLRINQFRFKVSSFRPVASDRFKVQSWDLTNVMSITSTPDSISGSTPHIGTLVQVPGFRLRSNMSHVYHQHSLIAIGKHTSISATLVQGSEFGVQSSELCTR